jgi:hypothetical protein
MQCSKSRSLGLAIAARRQTHRKHRALPGSLSTVTSPPIMRASLRERARPSPVPPNFCAVVESAWLNSSNSFACCSDVMPMPVSETANSTKVAAIAHLACRKLDLARFGELAGIAEEVEQDLLEPHGVHGERAQVLLRVNDEAVFVLLGKLSRGVDDLVDKPGQIHRLEIEVELAGFDLRKVEYLIDQAQEVGPGGIDSAQRLQRLLRAEARALVNHHLGQADDGVQRCVSLNGRTSERVNVRTPIGTPSRIIGTANYNAIRPHASLGYKPPAPEVFVPAFAAWPAALRQPAPPATLAQPPTLN